MSKGVLFFTCVLCAATTAALFAQQSDAYQQGQSGTYSRDSGQYQQRDSGQYEQRDTGQYQQRDSGQYQQRDIERYGTESPRYRDQSTFREDWSTYRDDTGRGQYGYRGTEDAEEFDTFERRGARTEEPWATGQTYRDRERYDRGTRMRDAWQRSRMGEAGELRSGQRLAVIAKVTNENARIPGVNPDHQVAQLRTREGSTLFVDLGPSDQAQDLDLSKDQAIFARGRLVHIEGHPVVMAQEVAKVSQRMQIERRGEEMFSMERPRDLRQQRERDLYGYTEQQDSGWQQDTRQDSRMRRQDQEQEQQRSRQYDIEGQNR